MNKKKVAVFFGGKSLEHDISILTALGVCNSIDFTKYEVMPIYVDLDNNWWFGNDLLDRGSYPLNDYVKQELLKVRFVIEKNKGFLESEKSEMFFCSLVPFVMIAS